MSKLASGCIAWAVSVGIGFGASTALAAAGEGEPGTLEATCPGPVQVAQAAASQTPGPPSYQAIRASLALAAAGEGEPGRCGVTRPGPVQAAEPPSYQAIRASAPLVAVGESEPGARGVTRLGRVRAAQAAASQTPQPSAYEAIRAGTRLEQVAGMSESIVFRQPIKRVSVGQPDVADVLTISANELLVIAKKPGVTNLVVWHENGRQASFDLVVRTDAEEIEREIRELHPQESIRVRAMKDSIVVSGTTEHAFVRESVGKVAEAFAPKKTVNLVAVNAKPEQVSLKVRIAEVSRDSLRELGLGFLGRDPGEIGVFPGSPLFVPFGNLRNIPPVGPDLSFGTLVNFFISDSQRKLGLFLRALEERGDLRTLAEPRLVTLTGQEAKFLAGGEIPIPVPQGRDIITIQYKPFGVQLSFTPVILEDDRIRLKLAPEVSDLDFGQAVFVAGVKVPAITKRRTETVVELKSGQTFAISGLLQNQTLKVNSKIPWIGDVPVLGKLFASERLARDETELLVLITPEIVKRVKADDPMPLPPGAGLGRPM